MLTWPNGIDLESSGKIENVLERSLRQKKQTNKDKNQQLQITRNGWWEIDKKAMADVLLFGHLQLKSWKVAV